MHKRFGISCIILGICCLIASVGLIAYNRLEEINAQKASQNILQEVRESIPDNTFAESTTEDRERDEFMEITPDILGQMPTIPIDGYDCMGILSIPVLELELPVLTDWNYTKLRTAPCHYYGSCYEKNFVIGGHNYQSHFGRLSELQPEDLILFTDIAGTVYCYEVILLETLPGNAVEEMITSGFDLSLYTCTLGGSNRVTVRCNAVDWSKAAN